MFRAIKTPPTLSAYAQRAAPAVKGRSQRPPQSLRARGYPALQVNVHLSLTEQEKIV